MIFSNVEKFEVREMYASSYIDSIFFKNIKLNNRELFCFAIDEF